MYCTHVLPTVFFAATCIFTVSCDLSPPQHAANSTKGKFVVGVIAGGTTTFWKSAEYGAIQTAEKNDLHLLWQETSLPDDFEQQSVAIRNFVSRRVHGMIIASQNELMIRDTLRRAKDQGVHVLLMDCPPLPHPDTSDSQISVVATDQFHAGQLAAEELASLLQEKGRVAIIRYSPLSLKTEHRENGFLAQIQSYPEIDVVGQDLYTGMDPRLAHDKMENFLQLYSQNGNSSINGIFISDESTACEMLSLLKQDKMEKIIHFVAFGSDSRLTSGMLTYFVDTLFVEQPVRMGQLAVDTMAEMLRGKTIDPFLDSGVHRITIDNLFSPYTQALLHPTVENSLEILLNKFPDINFDKTYEDGQ